MFKHYINDFVIGENVKRDVSEKKNGFNKQHRSKSNDTIIYLICKNAHRNIDNGRSSGFMYGCRTDNAMVFR